MYFGLTYQCSVSDSLRVPPIPAPESIIRLKFAITEVFVLCSGRAIGNLFLVHVESKDSQAVFGLIK